MASSAGCDLVGLAEERWFSIGRLVDSGWSTGRRLVYFANASARVQPTSAARGRGSNKISQRPIEANACPVRAIAMIHSTGRASRTGCSQPPAARVAFGQQPPANGEEIEAKISRSVRAVVPSAAVGAAPPERLAEAAD